MRWSCLTAHGITPCCACAFLADLVGPSVVELCQRQGTISATCTTTDLAHTMEPTQPETRSHLGLGVGANLADKVIDVIDGRAPASGQGDGAKTHAAAGLAKEHPPVSADGLDDSHQAADHAPAESSGPSVPPSSTAQARAPLGSSSTVPLTNTGLSNLLQEAKQATASASSSGKPSPAPTPSSLSGLLREAREVKPTPAVVASAVQAESTTSRHEAHAPPESSSTTPENPAKCRPAQRSGPILDCILGISCSSKARQ